MAVTVDEPAGGRMYGQILRRGQAQFMAPLLKVPLNDHEFLRHDRVAGVIGPVRSRPVGTIIEFGVVTVVGNRVSVALHESAGVSKIEVGELSFGRQGGLSEGVIGVFGDEMRYLEVTDAGIVAEESVGRQGLRHDGLRLSTSSVS